jgi:hypothetical protein
MKAASLRDFLQDPFLSQLLNEIKVAGSMRSSLIDITHKCNLRCTGCYYFVENMDQYKKAKDDKEFEAFIEQERQRGTNMLTVVGGEPALEVERLQMLAQYFKLTVVTNGSIPIPQDGLENVRIAVSFWGDEQQDIILRGRGKEDIFSKALTNFKQDSRAGFYYTTLPGHSGGIASATERMVQNGNYVAYNFYADLANQGGIYNHKIGFKKPIDQINLMIDLYPDRIVSSPYINNTISNRQLFGTAWGYNVCPSVTYDHPENAERIANGKQYPSQFRAYNADLKTTRRCCIGNARDCETCTDLWATYGWIVGSMKEHLRSYKDFSNWLLTSYIFYMQTGFIDLTKNAYKLPEIYRRYRMNELTDNPVNQSDDNKIRLVEMS